MRKTVFTLLGIIMIFSSHAQEPTDSSLWVKLMYTYVDALKADIQYNKNLQFNKITTSWMLPLNRPYDKNDIIIAKNKVEVFITDTNADYSEIQRDQARHILKLLDTYENEAQRMINKFIITDPQMLDNLEYCNTPTIVHTFSKMYLRDWFNKSQISDFTSSDIPYLARIASQLKQMVDDLCRQETATPELLQHFWDMEFLISTNHTKKEAEK